MIRLETFPAGPLDGFSSNNVFFLFLTTLHLIYLSNYMRVLSLNLQTTMYSRPSDYLLDTATRARIKL